MPEPDQENKDKLLKIRATEKKLLTKHVFLAGESYLFFKECLLSVRNLPAAIVLFVD
jgi:hypothetical protein